MGLKKTVKTVAKKVVVYQKKNIAKAKENLRTKGINYYR